MNRLIKKLIKCPNCEEKGIRQTMGELLQSGEIRVKRHYFGDSTIIGGTNFYLVCYKCKTKVFIRSND